MKADEVHNLGDEEIGIELGRLRRHLFDLRAQTVTEKVEDPTQLRKTRRDIARLMTERRMRELGKAQQKA